MSTHDARHFQRVFLGNAGSQFNMLMFLLSMRANYDPDDPFARHKEKGGRSKQVVEETIVLFVRDHQDWFSPGSQLFGTVREILEERDPELLHQLVTAPKKIDGRFVD